MVIQNNNREIINKLANTLKVTGVGTAGIGLENKIQPVLEVNPEPVADIVRFQTANNTTATIFTTPTDRDFFLSGVTITAATTGGADDPHLNIVINGETIECFHVRLPITAGTPSHLAMGINLSVPIQIDRGTNITLTSGGVNITADATIVGYTKDTLVK